MPGLFKKISYTAFLLIFISCSEQAPIDNNDKITIAVTITPYKYLVGKIAEDYVNVVSSIPEGATPHHFEPAPKLIRSISSASYYFKVGRYMEFEDIWLQKLKGINEEMTVFDLSDSVSYSNNDPHIWLSPGKLKIISKNILNALTKILPGESTRFRNNYNHFIDSLETITRHLKNSFADIDDEKKVLLVYHGSWKYFAEDFGFRQISIEEGSKSASAKEFREILNVVRKSNVKVIFIDPQHSRKSAEVIAKDLKIVTDIINPLPVNLLENFYSIENKILAYYK